MDIIAGLTFILYIVFILGIGFYFYHRNKTLSDYMLGGRQLGPWVTALSAVASDMSGWLLLGLPGAVFIGGLSGAWMAIGLVIGAYVNWHLVAHRLRFQTEKLGDSLTLSEYFANRFPSFAHILRPATALTIIVFFVIYVSSGLIGSAKLFEYVFSIDINLALGTSAFIILLYTLMGGYNAVAWTDLFQGFLMLATLLVVPIAVFLMLDDMPTFASMQSQSQSLSLIGLISLLGWGLGYFGQPHILARFMSIGRVEYLPQARRIAMIWMLLSIIGATAVGILGLSYATQEGLAIHDPEIIFLVLGNLIFHPVMASILMAAVLSAIMSTIDSQLLVSAASITQDIYRPWFRPKASDRECIMISRLMLVIVMLISTLMAYLGNETVLGIVSYAWAGFGASFGPVVVLSLYSKRINGQAAFVGMLSGALTVILWRPLEGGIFDLYELVPGVMVNYTSMFIMMRFKFKRIKT